MVKTFLLEKISGRGRLSMSRGVETEKTGTNVQNGGRGRRKCAGETLDFSHLKRPQKASF